jgi:hypothetical protein
MPLKSIGPSNISGFPTVTPCDPQQGFVSRPGGAFKFRSVQQITQSKQTNALNVAPKNPYQVCLCCHQWFIFNQKNLWNKRGKKKRNGTITLCTGV